MTDRCMRVTLWLALVPLVFGVWCLLIAGFDNFRLASAAGTIIGLALAIAIWRKYVRWAVLRSLSTTGLVVFTLAQVLIWHPLWAIGGCNMVVSRSSGCRSAAPSVSPNPSLVRSR